MKLASAADCDLNDGLLTADHCRMPGSCGSFDLWQHDVNSDHKACEAPLFSPLNYIKCVACQLCKLSLLVSNHQG